MSLLKCVNKSRGGVFLPGNRVGVYYRVSTKKQDYALQKNAFNNWKASLPNQDGIKFVEYEEKVSGKSKVRPQYDKMLEKAASGEHDTIVTWKLDRFSRDSLQALKDILTLLQNNVRVIFIDEQNSALNKFQEFDTGIFTLLISVMAIVAEQERKNTAERIKAALMTKKENEPDWKPGRRFGENRKYNKEQVEQITLLRDEGWSWFEIAKKCNIPTSTVRAIHKRENSI